MDGIIIPLLGGTDSTGDTPALPASDIKSGLQPSKHSRKMIRQITAELGPFHRFMDQGNGNATLSLAIQAFLAELCPAGGEGTLALQEGGLGLLECVLCLLELPCSFAAMNLLWRLLLVRGRSLAAYLAKPDLAALLLGVSLPPCEGEPGTYWILSHRVSRSSGRTVLVAAPASMRQRTQLYEEGLLL